MMGGARKLGWLFFLNLIGMLLGFFNQLVVSFYLGTSASLDGYWAVLAIANLMLFYVFPIRDALVPVVFKWSLSDKVKASSIFYSGVVIQLILVGFSAALLVLIPSKYLDIGSGSNFIFWIISYFFLFAIAETCNGLLLSFNRIVYQALSRLFSAIVGFVLLLIFIQKLGVFSLFISLIITQLITLLISVFGLREEGMRFVWGGFSALWSERKFRSVLLSLLISYFLAQGYVFFERSTMQAMSSGLVASFQYGVALVNAGITLSVYPVLNFLWPKFLQMNVNQDIGALVKLASNVLFPLCFILWVGCVFVYWYAPAVVELIFMRGAFEGEAISTTSSALMATVFTAIPIAIYSVFTRVALTVGHEKKLIFSAGAIAIIGMLLILISRFTNNTELIRWHWFVGNCAGAFSLVGMIMLNSHGLIDKVMRTFMWCLKSFFIVMIPLLVFPGISSSGNKISLVFDLLVRFICLILIVFPIAHFLKVIRVSDWRAVR